MNETKRDESKRDETRTVEANMHRCSCSVCFFVFLENYTGREDGTET